MKRIRFAYITKIVDFDNYEKAYDYVRNGVRKGWVFESQNHEFSNKQEKIDVEEFIFEHRGDYIADLFNELPLWKKKPTAYYSVKAYVKLD